MFQGPFQGNRPVFTSLGTAAAQSRMNEMTRLAELTRLQQLSQMNQMQITRLQELTRASQQDELMRFQEQDSSFNPEGLNNQQGQEHLSFEQDRKFDSLEGSGQEESQKANDFRDRELVPPGLEEDNYSSRGRDRDREQRDVRNRDRGRDRERRRESDRRSGDWGQDRERSRHHSRDRSTRDRSPVQDQYSRDGMFAQDYDMEEDDGRSRGRGRMSDDKWGDSNLPSRKIILRGMHTNVDEKMINEELVKFGLPVKDIRLIRRSSGISRGFAFVEFHNLSDAQRWMEHTQGSLMLQNQYRASLAYSIQRDRGGSRDNSNMQRFDWVCSKCLGHNFKRRDFCFNCNLPRKESEKGKPSDGQEEVGNNPCNTLIFRGLDALTTEESLVTAVNQVAVSIGPIKNVSIVRDEMSTSRGFGFLEFHSVHASTQVLEALTHLEIPLEVDGKQLIINYAKNTFNTTMAYIQQQQTAQAQYYDQNSGYYNQQGQYYDPVSQQYYNYNDYYNQTGNTPTSSSAVTATSATTGENSTNSAAAVAHAAIQQAQAVKNLHKQVQKKTVGGAEFITVNGVDYPVYPPPDTSQYQYEETSGFYYDPTTRLYYDPNSQYYYNSTTGQYMYWDAEKSTYLPAPTNSENQAGFLDGQDGGDKKDGKEKRDTKEKSKMAKKIAKDMEKWAKSMNAQKEAQKDVFKRPMGPPMMPGVFGKQESAAADAGFAILQKATEDKPALPPPLMKPDVPPAGGGDKPGLVASYGGDSDSGDEEDSTAPVDEAKLVDWTKLACLLCKRQFQSKEILSKHTQVSELHKKNLESLQRSREAASNSKIEYRDRAKERRQKYGAPGPPEPYRRNDVGEEESFQPSIVPEEPTKFGIGGDNIGNKLLQKMGWSSGQGLGKDNQGRVDPVEAKRRNQAAGLGARGAKVVADVGDNYRDAIKKSMFARYSEGE